MKPTTILIKKYENRRLYDTTNSRYLNLDQVAMMVQNGDDVRVVDAATGKDITRLILTQIIVEDAKTPDSTFPVDILRQMVIATGRAGQESALAYMKAMLDISRNTFRAVAPGLNPFDTGKVATEGSDSESQPVKPTAKGHRDGDNNSNTIEVDGLKQRLAELESIVAKLAPKNARGKNT